MPGRNPRLETIIEERLTLILWNGKGGWSHGIESYRIQTNMLASRKDNVLQNIGQNVNVSPQGVEVVEQFAYLGIREDNLTDSKKSRELTSKGAVFIDEYWRRRYNDGL